MCMQLTESYDVIVVGGGHAGTEAALAAARMGCETLLITHSIETLGQMSCNPSIGGIGKGHLVKEIDAMGGAMAAAADEAGIQFRILNSRKGPAVRATRAQADRVLYRKAIRGRLESQPQLRIFQQAVDDLLIENERVTGVVTQVGLKFFARAVVLTTGTFLAGRIHVGLKNYQAGRAGDPPAVTLAQRLRELVCVIQHGNCRGCCSPRPRKENTGTGASPGCSVITEKSMLRPSIRGGVPVFSRPTGSLNSRSRCASVTAGGSPARPAW